jgi:NAD(P)-dependent dehydrogenase (short-subunit alcohol dehydrogenase family)
MQLHGKRVVMIGGSSGTGLETARRALAEGEVLNVANGATTLTRNLCPLIDSGWVAVGTGEDRRQKLVRITCACFRQVTLPFVAMEHRGASKL